MTSLKKKWLAALRSEEYSQARGALRLADQMCCLGVGCDTFMKATGRGEWHFNLLGFPSFSIPTSSPLQHFNIPPTEVLEALGITLQQVTQLTDLNDVKKWTFPQIAQWLEDNT